jgi:DNA-directed RNA polymerase specialized sigma24 family protein
MSSTGSVSVWIEQLKAGEQVAAQKLWENYFQRLVALARAKLRNAPRRAADEEDVALSAFDSFCRGAALGRFPQLADRDELWQLLVAITNRKAVDLLVHEHRQKRGGGTVKGESALQVGQSPSGSPAGFDKFAGHEPSPDFAAQIAEECRRLLGLLGDSELRAVALFKMEGFTNDEIAAKLECVPRTVERKLRMIRSRWSREISP